MHHDTTIFNWSAGMRYGRMQQALLTNQDVSVATGLVSVGTEIDFDGFGLLLGIDAERRSCASGMLCYTKGAPLFLAESGMVIIGKQIKRGEARLPTVTTTFASLPSLRRPSALDGKTTQDASGQPLATPRKLGSIP
ncbi:MAG: hypothetical protein R3C05_23345 [Pirellulaceae bacterium]